jgi:hypothetical protein
MSEWIEKRMVRIVVWSAAALAAGKSQIERRDRFATCRDRFAGAT